MTTTSAAAVRRSGVARGLIEFRQAFSGSDLIGQLFWPLVTLAAIYFCRDLGTGAGGLALGTMMFPGVLGMFVAFGMFLVIQFLAADRDDGTLLRAKATPGGIPSYLLAMLVNVSLSVVVYLLLVAVPGSFLVDGLDAAGPRAWVTLAWVLLLGLAATQLLGAALGSLVSSPRGAGYIALVVLALTAVSGIFYPLTAMPVWLQWVGQAFPIYWLGLGMRSGLLPDAAAAIEVTGSWRTWETLAVLIVWTIVGLAIAPPMLRAMAQRESGSRVTQRRERALQRAA
jgi:ABC-2 type transport system permease protein